MTDQLERVEAEHASLDEAILAFKAEMPAITKDKTNPAFHSKYAGLDSIVEAVEPLLTKHGLLWETFPTTNEHGQPALRYRIRHVATREEDGDVMPLLLGKADMQGIGSAVTYARRYTLCAVLNLVADEDDDGNRAAGGGQAIPRRNGPSDKQKGKLAGDIKRNSIKAPLLRAMLNTVGREDLEIREGWMDELTSREASALIDTIAGGVIPTGESDIPSDMEPAPEPPADGDDLPFDARELEETPGA